MSAQEKPSLRRARKRERSLIKKIAEAHNAGKMSWARRLTREYLHSYHAHLVAAHEANRKLKQHRRVDPAKLPMIADQLDPWAGTEEPVTVNFKLKKTEINEIYRPTCDFGIENRALQCLVGRVLRALVDLNPHQFMFHGGVPAAVDEALHNLNEGYGYLAEIDIKDCFPSFEEEAVKNILPLPREVTEQAILFRSLTTAPGNIQGYFGTEPSEDEVSEVQRGLPQGSAVSPLVVDALLANVFPALPQEGRVVCFVDNFLIMAKDETDFGSMVEALCGALLHHPAGPLTPKFEWGAQAQDGFEFLGCSFVLKGGDFKVSPSYRNLAKFEWKLKTILKGAKKIGVPQKKKARLLNDARKLVRTWSAGFPRWDKRDEFRAQNLFEIKELEFEQKLVVTNAA